MFTGIIEEVGHVRHIGSGTLDIAARTVLTDAQLGDSIAVNGICLTLTSFTAVHFTADVMPETVRRTSLRDLQLGSPVNLERALLPTTRLGGHFVSGHIDGTGTIAGLRAEGNALWLTVTAAPDILQGIVTKGSVALDGISLTVVDVSDTAFTVSLIPHTRAATNLQAKGPGDLLNIETDILGKYVQRFLQGQRMADAASKRAAGAPQPSAEAPALTAEFLQANGF